MRGDKYLIYIIFFALSFINLLLLVDKAQNNLVAKFNYFVDSLQLDESTALKVKASKCFLKGFKCTVQVTDFYWQKNTVGGGHIKEAEFSINIFSLFFKSANNKVSIVITNGYSYIENYSSEFQAENIKWISLKNHQVIFGKKEKKIVLFEDSKIELKAREFKISDMSKVEHSKLSRQSSTNELKIDLNNSVIDGLKKQKIKNNKKSNSSIIVTANAESKKKVQNINGDKVFNNVNYQPNSNSKVNVNGSILKNKINLSINLDKLSTKDIGKLLGIDLYPAKYDLKNLGKILSSLESDFNNYFNKGLFSGKTSLAAKNINFYPIGLVDGDINLSFRSKEIIIDKLVLKKDNNVFLDLSGRYNFRKNSVTGYLSYKLESIDGLILNMLKNKFINFKSKGTLNVSSFSFWDNKIINGNIEVESYPLYSSKNLFQFQNNLLDKRCLESNNKKIVSYSNYDIKNGEIFLSKLRNNSKYLRYYKNYSLNIESRLVNKKCLKKKYSKCLAKSRNWLATSSIKNCNNMREIQAKGLSKKKYDLEKFYNRL